MLAITKISFACPRTLNEMATGKGQYHVLEVPQPADLNKRILGSVIPSDRYTAPFDYYAPFLESPKFMSEEGKQQLMQLAEMMDSFWKTSSVKYSMSVHGACEAYGEDTKLSETLHAYYGKDCRCDAVEFEQFTLDNPGRAIHERLGKCDPWMEELQAMYNLDQRKDPKYWIVTGVLTVKNNFVSRGENSSGKIGDGSRTSGEAVTAGAAAGTSSVVPAAKSLDSGVERQQSGKEHQNPRTNIDQQAIFALRYHQLCLDTEPEQNTGIFGRLRLKSTARKLDSDTIDQGKPQIRRVSLGRPIREKGWWNPYGTD